MQTNRTVLVALAIGTLVAGGCGRNESAKLPYAEGTGTGELQLLGRWEWVETTGGIAGIRRTPEQAGTTWSLEFREKSYTELRSDAPPVDRAYWIETRPVAWDPTALLPAIITAGEPEQVVEFPDANTLRLSDNVIDGFFHLFVRDHAP
jgi:hypothetical protein